MKNKLMKFNTIFLFLIAVFFSSCTSYKTSDFTAQKYTNFKKGDCYLAIPRTSPCISEQSFTQMPALSCYHIEKPTLSIPKIEYANNTSVPVVEKPVIINNTLVKTIENFNIPIERSKIKSFLAERFFEKPNTASITHTYDAELLLLVIIALLLPPLAVLLDRGTGNEFLLSIILTILFWVPGQIYALLVVFGIL